MVTNSKQARKHVWEMWSRHAITPPTITCFGRPSEAMKLQRRQINWTLLDVAKRIKKWMFASGDLALGNF